MTNQHTHGPRAHEHAAAAGSPDDALTGLLELDGEVLHGYWSAALDWVASAAPGAGRLLDLGTGTGALGLAERFPEAEVVAVDIEPGSLARLRDKALALGLAGRVRPVEAD